jgi:hypothetical protein
VILVDIAEIMELLITTCERMKGEGLLAFGDMENSWRKNKHLGDIR